MSQLQDLEQAVKKVEYVNHVSVLVVPERYVEMKKLMPENNAMVVY